MNANLLIKRIWPICLILLISCVEPYIPEVSSNAQNILVIDSFFNTNGTSEVTLTKSSNLYDISDPQVVSKAIVKVENAKGLNYSFIESAPGHYTTSQSNLPLDMTYRLLVITPDGKRYASPFVQASPAAEIDSITWELTKDNGVQVYANSRDLKNKTRRYLWKYTETWLYKSAYQSSYIWENGTVRSRDNSDADIYRCYQTEYSTKILYYTTESLGQDVVSRFPVTYIPETSEKISNKYSILVTQFGLTQEGLDYWTELKKNTENLGSLFDPQPSLVTGNFKNIDDPNETVLGFFSAGTSTEKRLFIPVSPVEKVKLKIFSFYDTEYKNCYTNFLDISKVATWTGSDNELFISAISAGRQIIGYTFSSKECVDCRRKNGTNIKPAFWE